jgi:hypothetical protein
VQPTAAMSPVTPRAACREFAGSSGACVALPVGSLREILGARSKSLPDDTPLTAAVDTSARMAGQDAAGASSLIRSKRALVVLPVLTSTGSTSLARVRRPATSEKAHRAKMSR